MESTRNQLINLLAENKHQYISGQTLSEKLNISRSAIWKHMNELKKDGYSIEGVRKKGYRVTGFPEKISENTLQWGLNTKWMGHTIIHKKTTSSTQLIMHQLASDNKKHGTVVVADEQLKGKGRMNREWFSAENKGIWMSILLRPYISPHLAPQLTLLTAIVLAEVISSFTEVKVQIKWTNDILINGKKVAGILTEMQSEQDQIQYIVLGIGVNVLQEKDDLPHELRNKATSLKLETSTEWDIRELIQAILVLFEKTYELYMDTVFSKIKRLWEYYGFKIGEPILIKTLKKQWKAVFYGIAEDGALLAKKTDDSIKKIYSAEIDWFGESE